MFLEVLRVLRDLIRLLAEDVADQRQVALRVVHRADLALELRVEQVVPALHTTWQHRVVPRDADRAVVPRHAGAGAVGLDPEVALVALEVRVQVLHVGNLLRIERREQLQLAVQGLVALVVGDQVVAALAVGGDQLRLDVVVGPDVGRLDVDVVGRLPVLHRVGQVVALPRQEVDRAADRAVALDTRRRPGRRARPGCRRGRRRRGRARTAAARGEQRRARAERHDRHPAPPQPLTTAHPTRCLGHSATSIHPHATTPSRVSGNGTGRPPRAQEHEWPQSVHDRS